MSTITIPKKEYEKLIEKEFRYEYLREVLEADIFGSPPTRNIKEVMRAMKTTNKYTAKFLNSLEKGLKHSSYFKT